MTAPKSPPEAPEALISAKRRLEDELQAVILEQRRLEGALRASEAQLAGVLAIAGDAIIAVDDEQRIITYNEGAEQVFGWKKDEVLARSLDMLIPAQLRDTHRAHIRALKAEPLRARRTGMRNIVGLRKNGEEFEAEAEVSMLDLESSSLFTVVLRDISNRMRLERAQRRHLAEQTFLGELDVVLTSSLDYQERLTRTAELMTAFFADIAIIDLLEGDAIRRARIVHADPAKAELASCLAAFHPERDAPSLILPVLQSKKPNLVSDLGAEHLELYCKNEEHRKLIEALRARSVVVVPLLAQGKVIGALTLISTQPDRRYAEHDLTFASEVGRRAGLAVENARLYNIAKEAIAARDEVLGIVAHDLRSPLSGMRMLAKGLVAKIRANPTAAVDYASEIMKGGERMDKLIQALLDITRFEAGKLPTNCSPVAIDTVIDEVKKSCTPILEAERMRFRFDVPAGLPRVFVDLDRILQVFTNLIGNAAKFAPPGSTVSVRASWVADMVEFSVVDEGPGILPDHLAHLFDRFWQASHNDRRGAGLGLAIVKGIVESHGGRVSVKSEVGKGTTVAFTIPIADEEASSLAGGSADAR
jgi:PAS domain S-box-containing protein